MKREEAELITFLAELKFEDLPEETVEEAGLRLLDQVGVILAGTGEPAAALAISYAQERGGSPEATLFGPFERVDAELAAFANGVSGHVLELDDGNRFAMGHPGVVVAPTVLALGEALGSSGREVLTALVVGYELFVRLGTAVNPSHYNRGFHTTGTVGTMAAAAAASRLFGLDRDGMASALGLAGSQAGGLFEFLADGAMSKQLHAGQAAGAAIRSARLARSGFTGPVTVLQGTNGFMRALADEADASHLNRSLAETYAVQQCYVKLHACCRHIHPVVDAVLELMECHDITADEVKGVNVATYAFGAKLDKREIDTDLDAKMSTPFSVATTLLEGASGLHQFRPALFHDERVVRLMRLVNVTLDEELDALVPEKRGCRVQIETLRGTFATEALLPRGEPESAVGQQEIHEKYMGLVSGVLNPDAARTYADAVLNLAEVGNVADLNQLLAAPAPTTSPGATNMAGWP